MGLENLRNAFTPEKTWIYLLPMDSYNGQQSFGLAFKEGVHPREINKQRAKDFAKEKDLQYYNHNMHLSSFCLPTWIKRLLEGKEVKHEEFGK